MITVYWVSTPRFTICVEVEWYMVAPNADRRARILPTTARYLHRSYGNDWDVWRERMARQWGTQLRVVALGKEEGTT